jgi:GGDEF domain-containing protein
MHFLEELYLHVRFAELLAQHARRSDVVVRASRGMCFVVSPGTEAHGAFSLAERVARSALSELGMTVYFGLASFPGDGETPVELMTVAAQRARAGSESTNLSAVASALPPEPAQAAAK